MNKLATFSENQRSYLRKTKSCWLNVAEGGKRGGKNVLNTFAYCLCLENHPDKLHLIAGVSTTTARLNIMDCDGMGLTNYFEHRYREGKYKDRPCLYISTLTGEKIILVSGGGKNGDERLIKGNTYGTAYITEVNECAQSFVKEVFDRTISSSDRKIFHDLNPKEPNHWYYDEILKFHEDKQIADSQYGYNYGHFTIADNFSISDDKLRKILDTYEKGTVWYDRDIKGKRKRAEGLVFPKFADDPDAFIINAGEVPKRFKWIDAGFDIGGNGSAYAMTFSAMDYNNVIYVLKASKKQAQDVPMEEVDRYVFDEIQAVESAYGVNINNVNTDHVDVIINTLNEKRYIFGKTYKPPLEDRPFQINMLMAQGRLKFVEKQCDDLVDELQNVVFDDKAEKAIILDDGSMQIDTIDSFVYSLADNWHYLND